MVFIYLRDIKKKFSSDLFPQHCVLEDNLIKRYLFMSVKIVSISEEI